MEFALIHLLHKKSLNLPVATLRPGVPAQNWEIGGGAHQCRSHQLFQRLSTPPAAGQKNRLVALKGRKGGLFNLERQKALDHGRLSRYAFES
jgi:hypothetical protein